MYSILFHKNVEKQFKRLDIILQKRIQNNLKRIRIRPQHFVKKLVGNPFYALRVGEHRIILDIVNRKLIIYVLEIGHRKNIYAKNK